MRYAVAALALLPLAGCHDEAARIGARDHIAITGSSTVFPFTSLVAERFAITHPEDKAPVVEATGTDAGIKQFCAGTGDATPDILDASRRLRRSDLRDCAVHGVVSVMELEIGLDGIALAQSRAGPKLAFTLPVLYKALAANPNGRPNTTGRWKDADEGLPAIPIDIYGPPSTSGTRDVLASAILAPGCEALDPSASKKKENDPAGYAKACETIRSDGTYHDDGENNDLTVRKVRNDPHAVGIFGYSYLQANADRLRAIPIDGKLPTAKTIAAGEYAGARPLYVYVKTAHLNAVRGLREFLDQYRSMWAAGGPLTKRGLIAAPPPVLDRSADVIKIRHALDTDDLS